MTEPNSVKAVLEQLAEAEGALRLPVVNAANL